MENLNSIKIQIQKRIEIEENYNNHMVVIGLKVSLQIVELEIEKFQKG